MAVAVLVKSYHFFTNFENVSKNTIVLITESKYRAKFYENQIISSFFRYYF